MCDSSFFHIHFFFDFFLQTVQCQRKSPICTFLALKNFICTPSLFSLQHIPAFYECFTATSTTEMYLEKIKDCLFTLAATSTDDNKFQQVIKEIADYVYQHSIVFHSTVKRLQEVKNKPT
jgi:hypothetical protein